MAKVNVIIKCGDVGLFGDSSCAFPFNLMELEEGNDEEAYKKFKEQAVAHYLQHKESSAYDTQEKLNAELEKTSSFGEFKKALYSSKAIIQKIH